MKRLNAYTLPEDDNSDEGAQNRTYTPHCHTHLVAGNKYDRKHERLVQAAEKVYAKAESYGGIRYSLERDSVRVAARQWWQGRKGTITGMHFSEI